MQSEEVTVKLPATERESFFLVPHSVPFKLSDVLKGRFIVLID